MTVAELIEKLSAFPPQTEVWMPDYGCASWEWPSLLATVEAVPPSSLHLEGGENYPEGVREAYDAARKNGRDCIYLGSL